jgi:hypothetical protein
MYQYCVRQGDGAAVHRLEPLDLNGRRKVALIEGASPPRG